MKIEEVFVKRKKEKKGRKEKQATLLLNMGNVERSDVEWIDI